MRISDWSQTCALPIFPDRSIVFSGDTRASDNLTALAAGADILVHEANHLPGIERQAREQVAGGLAMAPADFVQHIARAHTPIGDVGKIAQRAGVGTLVLRHIYPDDVAARSAERRVGKEGVG